MGNSISKKRYKNVDRQKIHDDLALVAQCTNMTITRYCRMCEIDSSFYVGVLAGKRNPTEHLLRQMARDLTQAGHKRRWRDYLLPEERPEPEQMSFTEAWGYPQVGLDLPEDEGDIRAIQDDVRAIQLGLIHQEMIKDYQATCELLLKTLCNIIAVDAERRAVDPIYRGEAEDGKD